jgi:hypothetical protein
MTRSCGGAPQRDEPRRTRTSSPPIAIVALSLLLAGVACGGSSTSTSVLRASPPAPTWTGLATPSHTRMRTPGATATPPTIAATSGVAGTVSPPTVLVSPRRITSPTSAPTGWSSPMVLTEPSSGRTVQIRIGQSIDVTLPGGANGGYEPPASSSSSSDIVRRTTHLPAQQPALPPTAAAVGRARPRERLTATERSDECRWRCRPGAIVLCQHARWSRSLALTATRQLFVQNRSGDWVGAYRAAEAKRAPRPPSAAVTPGPPTASR